MTYFGASRLFQAQAVSVAASQNALYVRSLNEALKQHQHLPFVIGENRSFSDHVAMGSALELNATLARFAEASELEAIYIMDMDGEVVAASNYRQSNSFLGQNYGFRPYFQLAAAGDRSAYFAIGATTGRPGYFVAEPLTSETGDTVGVVAIKLDISELQASWQERGEQVLATNRDGIVVMSSNPEWLYLTVEDLAPERRAALVDARQFGEEQIARLDWQEGQEGRVNLQGNTFLVTSGPTEYVDWTVHYLTSAASVQRQTILATVVLGAFLSGLIAFSVFLRSRRIQAALDLSQMQRKELERANHSLVVAQEELARSSKLVALGQLAASVTHELGQPISALKNHLFAAEIGGEITSPNTLSSLRRLADRMEATTKQLRFFARQTGEDWATTDLETVINEALDLVRHNLEANEVRVHWTRPEERVRVRCHRLQMEQAVVNLLRNAEMAVRDTPDPEIRITCAEVDTRTVISIADNGPGLMGKDLPTMEEPFFSSRSSGDGMGLGLAITGEILRAHGGHVAAHDNPEGGAVFSLVLPKKDSAP
ncbi:MAG: ATP-binding protein [Pseudomonadota bacterium]